MVPVPLLILYLLFDCLLARNLNYNSGGGNVKVEEAAKAAAEYNKMINRERMEMRKSYFDIQTFAIHYPKTG
jgi:hypothetical protein